MPRAAVVARPTTTLVAVGVLLAVSLAALKVLPAPFVWISLLWGLGLCAMAARNPAGLSRHLMFGAGGVMLAFGAAEAALAATAPVPVLLELNPRYDLPDSLLGWRLRPGVVAHGIERVGDSTIYDVTYTVDSAGRRVAPPELDTGAAACVLFFGDSFTFGKGVADTAALPYRVGVATGGRVRVVNFGVPAYGPQQTLAALERGMLEPPAACHPTHIIYQALAHDVLRAAHRLDADRYTPRYAIGDDGVLRFLGTSQPDVAQPMGERLAERVVEQLRKSSAYRALSDREPSPSPADLRLYLAIVRRFRADLADRYPQADFHVLLWVRHGYSAGVATMRDDLLKITPYVHVVDDLLPGYDRHPERYELHPREQLPNTRTYQVLSAFVADSIIGRTS